MRGELRRLAELLALTGLAIVQPVLDVLGRSPETFVFRGVEHGDLVLFALVVAFAPALALWAIGLLVGLAGRRARRVAHVVSIGGLVAVAVLVGVKWADWVHGLPALAVATAAGLGAAALYTRAQPARDFLVYLSPLPLVAALLFLFASPVSDLVTGEPAPVAEDVRSTRPVVFLLLDEFPTATLLDTQGRVDAGRYPNFARLSQDATWFRNYTTVNASTTRAVPALLSGDPPEEGQQPLYTDHPHNLFTLLGGSYRMNVYETVTQLCPPGVCDATAATRTVQSLLAREGLPGITSDAWGVFRQLVALHAVGRVQVDEFAEEVVPVEAPSDIRGDPNQVRRQPARFQAFLDGLVDVDEPTLHFVHLILPHGPWRFFPDGTQYDSPPEDPPGAFLGVWTEPWPPKLTRLRHQLQAQYTDALLGQLVRRLHDSGLWDRATFVVVADHGGSFLQGEGGRALTDGNAHEVMWSPLFVHDPGLPAGTDDVNIQSIDLLPTLADLLGADLPWPVTGHSVVGAPEDGDATKRYDRFQNFLQPQPTATLRIDGDRWFHRLLTDHRPIYAAADPVGDFYRRTPLAPLLGRPVEQLEVGDALDVTMHVDELDELTGEPDATVPAYLGGALAEGTLEDGEWVVAVVNDRVAGVSPIFAEVGRDDAFAMLFAEDAVAPGDNELELYATRGPGDALHPVRVEG